MGLGELRPNLSIHDRNTNHSRNVFERVYRTSTMRSVKSFARRKEYVFRVHYGNPKLYAREV